MLLVLVYQLLDRVLERLERRVGDYVAGMLSVESSTWIQLYRGVRLANQRFLGQYYSSILC